MKTLLQSETLMTGSVLYMTMSLSLERYYKLHVGKEDSDSDGCQAAVKPLNLRQLDAMSESARERSGDSGI